MGKKNSANNTLQSQLDQTPLSQSDHNVKRAKYYAAAEELVNATLNSVAEEPLNETSSNPNAEELQTQTESTSRLHVNIPSDILSNLRFTTAYANLQRQIAIQMNTLKDLRSESKRLMAAYEHDIHRVYKNKRRRRGNFEPTGFIKKSLLPNNLADLLGVAHGTTLSTPEITKRFYDVLKERQLYDEKDHRIFRPDAQTRQVFGLSDNVLTSTSHKDKNGFNFMTLQRHLSQCLKQVNDVEQSQSQSQSQSQTQTPSQTQSQSQTSVLATEQTQTTPSRNKRNAKNANSSA